MISPMSLYAIFDLLYISWPYTFYLIALVILMVASLVYLVVVTVDRCFDDKED